MEYTINQISKSDFPIGLDQIPEPPKQLFLKGELPRKENKVLCVVGSRKYTPYGKTACEKIISGLSGYPITILSGLALGIDSIAHNSAIVAGLQTIAIPGSGLDPKVIYPRSNVALSNKILESGGGLVSELSPTTKAATWTFPMRNRIMAGMSDAILVVEAEEKSGTLITSRLGTDYNKEVFAIPGSIFSPQSFGPNMLIKLGATPITDSQSILTAFGIDTEKKEVELPDLSTDEKVIYDLIEEGLSKNDLLRISPFETSKTQAILISLELMGIIKEELGKVVKQR